MANSPFSTKKLKNQNFYPSYVTDLPTSGSRKTQPAFNVCDGHCQRSTPNIDYLTGPSVTFPRSYIDSLPINALLTGKLGAKRVIFPRATCYAFSTIAERTLSLYF
jgi:hypothetical protein